MNEKVMDVMAVNNGDNWPTAIVDKTREIVKYFLEHDEHPQAESLVAPNRVKIDEGYYASIRKESQVDNCRPGVIIWTSSVEGYLPCAAISDISVIINGPGITPEQVDFLLAKFQALLNTSFFQG